jgi:hypothetical protein
MDRVRRFRGKRNLLAAKPNLAKHAQFCADGINHVGRQRSYLKRDRQPPDQRWHRQRGDQHNGPRRHLDVRVAHAQQLQNEGYRGSEQQRTQCGFREQRYDHFLLPFARPIRSASIRSLRVSSMALSAIPTRTSSTEPLPGGEVILARARCAAQRRRFVRGDIHGVGLDR